MRASPPRGRGGPMLPLFAGPPPARTPGSAPGRTTMRVGELVRRITLKLAEEFPSRFWVEGEISGFRPSRSGHVFVALTEANAQVKAVLWADARAALAFTPEDGMQVLARLSKVDFYGPYGELRVHVETLEPAGAGALALALEERRKRLEAEGLFAEARKRPLPFLPRVVGIATAQTGAVIHDILATLEKRHPGVQVILRPCAVQGPGAAADIASALDDLNRHGAAEVIIVGRGGGSAEDLMAFNEEAVVRAIVGSRVPVVSAVGHESDTTLADHAADRRAATPTAAAQLVMPLRDDLLARVDSLRDRLCRAAQRCRDDASGEIEGLRRRLGDPRVWVRERRRQLEAETQRALAALRQLTPERRARLGDQSQRALAVLRQLTPERRARLGDLGHRSLAVLRVATPRRRTAFDQLSRRATDALRALTPSRRARVDTLAVAVRRRAPDAAALRWQLERLGTNGVARMRSLLERARHELVAASGRAQAISPLAVLERGYALARDERGRLVRDAAELTVGSVLDLRFAHGEASAEVIEVRRSGATAPDES